MNYFQVNVELGRHVLSDKLVRPFAVYLALKNLCSGAMYINEEDIEKVCEWCGYSSRRSFWNQLEKLLELNWVGHDPRTDVYYIRGFHYLLDQYDIKAQTTFEVVPSRDLEYLREKLFAGGIGKIQNRRKSDRKTRGSQQDFQLGSGETFTASNISTDILSNYYGLSPATVSRYKWRAMDAGLLEYEHRYFQVAMPEHYMYVRDSFPELENRLFGHDGGTAVQGTDHFNWVMIKYKTTDQRKN